MYTKQFIQACLQFRNEVETFGKDPRVQRTLGPVDDLIKVTNENIEKAATERMTLAEQRTIIDDMRSVLVSYRLFQAHWAAVDRVEAVMTDSMGIGAVTALLIDEVWTLADVVARAAAVTYAEG